jgi:hypothetical protein
MFAKRRIAMVVTILISLLALGTEPAMAISQGDPCTTLNEIKKSGKTQFKCVGSKELEFWIQIPSSTPTKSVIANGVKQWNVYISKISLSPYADETSSSLVELDLNSLIEKQKIYLNKILESDQIAGNYASTANRHRATAKSFSDGLPGKKQLNDNNLATYQAAQSRTNAMSSQYQAALSSQASRLACEVLNTFGFGGSCPKNSYQEALDTQAIRTYNSLKSLSDAAYQDYKNANSDYLLSLKTIESLEEQSQLASDTSDLYFAKSAEMRALNAQIGIQVDVAKKTMSDSIKGLSTYVAVLSASIRASDAVDALGLATKANLNSKYKDAYLEVTFLKLAVARYNLELAQKPSYTPINFTIQDSQIWNPVSYFKASNYSDIERTQGLDIAWKWSKNSSCELKSPCKRLFIVPSEDCARAVIGLDFMTDSKISEAKTYSQEYAFKHAEISVIEIETKYSATATSAYIRSVKCLS